MSYVIKTTDRNRLAGLFAGLLLLGCLTLAGPRAAAAQDRDLLNRLVQTGTTDAAMMALRQGRDLLSEEKYEQAARIFSRFVTEYPSHGDVDAGLYWLAYAYERQSKFTDAETIVARMIQQHP